MCRIKESSFALLCRPVRMTMVTQKMSSGRDISRRKVVNDQGIIRNKNKRQKGKAGFGLIGRLHRTNK